jgi:hypothetical protein
MAGPRDKAEQAAAAPKGADVPAAIHNYYFVFGADQILRQGRMVYGDPDEGGLSLGHFFVLVHAISEGDAKGRMAELFGQNWAGVYTDEKGSRYVRRWGLRSLLNTGPTTAMEDLALCACGDVGFEHGIGWHTEYGHPRLVR